MLPWRETSDPYRIWLSEIILQQTRVNQGLPYYKSFVNAFPDVRSLACAKEDTVMRLWQGLGYYSRARNLHKCAKTIADKYKGEFPGTYDELLTLPGVGPYTAAAIASIAFNQKVAVVDGNVYRVLSRLFGITKDIASSEGKKHFLEMANSLVSETDPGNYNQAIMEFGAMHCTPVQPKCAECPFANECVALSKDIVSVLPVNEKKLKKKTRHLNYFVLHSGTDIAIEKRTSKDIWLGLYEFYLVETPGVHTLKEMISGDVVLSKLKKPEVKETFSVKHVLTHQLLHVRFFETEVNKENRTIIERERSGISFVSLRKVKTLPKPIVISRYLDNYLPGIKFDKRATFEPVSQRIRNGAKDTRR